MPRKFILAALLLCAGGSFSTLLGADLKAQSRVAILRELIAEFGTLRAPLPRGEKGLRLKASGEIDQESLVHEITQQGTAAAPSVLVQITQIVFKDKEILFEINGGGKKKTKWYEHIEIGMGSRTTPINTPNDGAATPIGSTITLIFPGKLPDMTVDEVKNYLGPVLDFEAVSPIQTITGPVPPEFQKAIENKEAVVGMNQDMVIAALGQPKQKVRETKDGVEQEDWIYGAPPLKVTFVTFEGDEVVNVQEYAGGVRGEVQEYPKEPPR
jgi:hypothetical protein